MPLSPTCHRWSPTGDINPILYVRGNLAATLHLNLPLGVTNEGREAVAGEANKTTPVRSQAIKQFLAPLPGTPLFKIGELHAIFYLCFLILLVCFLVFAFVSLAKNPKKISYLTFGSPSCLVKHVRIWCFEGIRGFGFPSKEWREYDEGLG